MPDDLPDLPPVEVPVKRGRGRPPGSRNRLSIQPVQTPPQVVAANRNPLPKLDFKYADPETLAARNMSLIDHAQQALRHEIGAGFQADGRSISHDDIEKILHLCAALDRAAAGMARVQKVAKELAENLTPEQTLEKAIQKVMGQDTATQRYVIRRLQENLKKLTKHHNSKVDIATATDAIAALTK
jgi:hypothetical protein